MLQCIVRLRFRYNWSNRRRNSHGPQEGAADKDYKEREQERQAFEREAAASKRSANVGVSLSYSAGCSMGPTVISVLEACPTCPRIIYLTMASDARSSTVSESMGMPSCLPEVHSATFRVSRNIFVSDSFCTPCHSDKAWRSKRKVFLVNLKHRSPWERRHRFRPTTAVLPVAA